MKINLIRKFKWYIIGFILVAIMLSVSLSFCSWDKLSLQSKLTQGNSGKYNDMVKLVEDKDKNNIASVGDKVSFGNYYQDANTVSKTPITWIVVDKINNELTLLSENIVTCGSFWGTVYYNNTEWVGGVDERCYVNYSKSTVRAWLNSQNIRNDGGPAIASSNSPKGVQFKGFLSEAFTATEQAYIISKTISGMKGVGLDNNPAQEYFEKVNDKVWLPSYIEMYGNTGITWGVGSDNLSDKQFSYFTNTSNSRVTRLTAFAASASLSNYTFTNITSPANSQGGTTDYNKWYWLRSPHPSGYGNSLTVASAGANSDNGSYFSHGGVRPAIIIPA